MNDKRWCALSMSDSLPLSTEEIAEGWHFCPDWDGLLIGPGVGEMASCLCTELASDDSEETR